MYCLLYYYILITGYVAPKVREKYYDKYKTSPDEDV